MDSGCVAVGSGSTGMLIASVGSGSMTSGVEDTGCGVSVDCWGSSGALNTGSAEARELKVQAKLISGMIRKNIIKCDSEGRLSALDGIVG